jgi:peptidoglycan/xylan/chitin deacetylase (PgdA/CDA1 family)
MVGCKYSRVLCFCVLLMLFFSESLLAQDLTYRFVNKWDGALSSEQEEELSFIRVTAADSGQPSFIEYTSPSPQSLVGRHIRFAIRINSFDVWGGVEVRLSSDASYQNYYAINIPYYSDPEFNIVQPGHWAEYSLSLGEANVIGQPRRDRITHIGIYVQGRPLAGMSAFELDIANFHLKSSMHSALISMTFDDGYEEQYRAAQIMGDFGLRGTAYVMTNEIDTPSYLTSAQLLSLKNDLGWGISSHHKDPITEMSAQQLESEILSTYAFLQNLGFGDEIKHFAYPLGKQSRATTWELSQRYFLSARVAGGGAETLPPADWLMLKTFNVTPDIRAEDLARRIDLAIENNEWLILMFHYFTDGDYPTDPLVYHFDEFEKLCEIIKDKGIPTHPVHEVYEAFNE